MSITSLNFIVFAGAAIVFYYILPEKYRPAVLTALSFFFVATYDYRGIVYMLLLSALIWASGLQIEKKAADRKNGGRGILAGTAAAAFLLLLSIKYLLPALVPADSSLALRLFVPIGISYYTLQAVSYVADVYWRKISAEKNYGRVLIFLSYFPLVLQGPISRYGDLSSQIFGKTHRFEMHNLKHGVQLMLWGFFKLSVVGARCGSFADYAFHMGSTAYGSAAVLGLVMFGFSLYGNFSGGIDVMRGLSECFAIELKDNFNQPFFSGSLGEFWRRWHITLGTWMKDYVFFPLSMSKPMSGMKKKLKKHIDRKTVNRIAIAIADVIVFLFVGLWHGLGTNYALWGLYNGVILAFSELMAVHYRRAKETLSIKDDSAAWRLFSILRTFVIITIGWCTDCAATASGSVDILINALQWSRTNMEIFNLTFFAEIRAAAAIVVLLLVDILHEKGISIRKWMDAQNIVVQMLFWALVIQAIACLRFTNGTGGLVYAGF